MEPPRYADATAACVPLVRYEGGDYVPIGATWQFPDGSLAQLGEASGANKAAGKIVDRRVYSIDGIEPAEGPVLNIGSGGAAVFLVPQYEDREEVSTCAHAPS